VVTRRKLYKADVWMDGLRTWGDMENWILCPE
jgi:hypothetical protein